MKQMCKNWALVVITFSFLLSLNSCNRLNTNKEEAVQAIFIPATNPQIDITGRYYMNNEVVEFANPATEFNLRFDGSLFSLIIENKSPDSGIYNANFVNVYIDNNEPMVLELKNSDTIYDLSGYLSTEEYHDVRIVRRTEAACGLCRLYGFYLEEGHYFIAPVAKLRRRIEFIGNSITCGYGVEAENASEGFTPATENAELSFAGQAAKVFNAQYSLISYSGIGIYRNSDTSWHQDIHELYQRIFPQHGRRWDFSRWIPDAVVINLGTNDFAAGIPDSNQFINSYLKLLNTVHLKYPEATIFCLTGPMLTNSWPIDPATGKPIASLTYCKRFIKQAVSRFQTSDFEKIYFFPLSSSGKYGYGANWHPGKKQSEVNAAELVEFMRPILNWED